MMSSSAQTGWRGTGNVTDNGTGLLFAYDDGGRLNTIWQSATVTGLLTLYNGMGELARTRKVTYDPCTNAEILLMMEYFGFAPDGRALHLRSENYSRTETDWVWLDGEPVAQFQDSYDEQGTYQGTAVTYLHTDHLGTPRIGTDEAQQVTWRRETDAFGVGTATGTAVVRLRMPGQIAYGLGGVDYNYYRDYFAQWGRYLESDPIGLDGGLNTYGYAGQNPLTFIDPFGLYGTTSCAYYSKRCTESGGIYYCNAAPFVCRTSPNIGNWTACTRQCLQDADRLVCKTACGEPADIKCITGAHLDCWFECARNSNRRSPTLPVQVRRR